MYVLLHYAASKYLPVGLGGAHGAAVAACSCTMSRCCQGTAHMRGRSFLRCVQPSSRDVRNVSKALPLPPALPPPPPQPAGTVHADRVSEAEMRKEWHYCDPSVRVPGL